MNLNNPNLEIIDSTHNDFIHDITFDFFGKRVATCSSDQEIKIWTKKDNKWLRKASFKAHDAIIWKVKWAHPDFGTILATCSMDKTVCIWEERRKSSSKLANVSSMINEDDEEESTWISRTKFLESKESIEDIKFAPKHLGLVIATAAADGILRIYECPDLMNLAAWRPLGEVQTNSLGINCISWNKNPFDKSMIIVGAKDPSSSTMVKTMMKVQSADSGGGGVMQQYINKNSPFNEDRMLSIYVNNKSSWSFLGKMVFDDMEHKSAVHDVSWAQLNGRSYHIIASCGKEGVFIWYLKFETQESKVTMNVTYAMLISNDSAPVWRCCWNFMGTLLAYSGEDNRVKIVKSDYNGSWNVVAQFETDLAEVEEEKKSEEKDGFMKMVKMGK